MSKLYRRQGLVLKTGTDATMAQFASSYTVRAFPVGGQASGSQLGTDVPMLRGHGFQEFSSQISKLLVYRDNAIDTTKYAGVTEVAAESIKITAVLSIQAGDILINLWRDGGASQPQYDDSRVRMWSDPGRVTEITSTGVTTDAQGNYRYWTDHADFWELIFDSNGTPVQLNTSCPVSGQMFNLMDFGARPDDDTFDNYLPIKMAVQALVDEDGNGGYPNAELFVPSGLYHVSTSGAFSSFTNSV